DKNGSAWFDAVRATLNALTANWAKKIPLTKRIRMHIDLAEKLAASDENTGAENLWRNEAGEGAATWFNDWQQAAERFPDVTGDEYEGLFHALMRTVTVRPTYGQHMRLSILGPLEARLIQADRIILGGLNEGTWPPETPVDPWMSRPMKMAFGLPSPERRIGLSAHDFAQLAAAPEVFLTRSRRAGNSPTVPSRFLLQLETVLQALGYSTKEKDCLASKEPWAEWARLLDDPGKPPQPCMPPEPKPPVAARPAKLSVTDIGTWRRNPYAIYARRILDLKKLEELDADVDASDRGTIIHAALEAFVKAYPEKLPLNAHEELLKEGRKVFEAYQGHPEVKAFWWPRFERAAEWFLEQEAERRNTVTKFVQSEAKGKMGLGNFTLEGRADRVEQLRDGNLAIVDYKTGTLPSGKSVKAGYEPQLPLLALIAEEGGFKDIAAAKVESVAYWKLSGGREAGTETIIADDVMDVGTLAQEARAGLEDLIKAYADQNMPYRAVPKLKLQPKYDDYAHLARLAEWGRTAEDE
ncbi:MAG TPA: double-strand break repair protein AddB, partial [Alphaproteobacteria bacterium]|nr:double-strand break repair protein AddB [Alphaproteobacteria bacterium]